MSAQPIRAALYARQSLDRAEGIERQLARTEALAAVRGYSIVERYVDNDTSASKDRSRGTAWARMIADADAGRIDVVIAVDVDRLLRSVSDLLALTATGARVLTVDGEIDLTTADGEFRATMLAGIARFEVRRKSERQLRANEDRRARGAPVITRRRYGYETDGVTPREPEAAVVRRMFQHVASGGSIRSLALALTAEGVDPAPGRSWSPGRVRYILSNPAYGGQAPRHVTTPDGRRTFEGIPSTVVTPIVDPDLAAEVRAILTDDARRTSPGPTPRYLGSSLATCGATEDGSECGESLMNLAGAYRCRASASHTSIKKERLDGVLRREVARAFLHARESIAEPRAATVAPLIDKLQRNEAAAVATATDRDEGLLSATAARARLVELRDERHRIEAAIDAARTDRSAVSMLADVALDVLADAPAEFSFAEYDGMVDEVAARFAEVELDRQREVVRALLDVTVYPGRDIRRVKVWHKVATALNPDAPDRGDLDGESRGPGDPAKRRPVRAERSA